MEEKNLHQNHSPPDRGSDFDCNQFGEPDHCGGGLRSRLHCHAYTDFIFTVSKPHRDIHRSDGDNW
jgi:hypothetical protein